MIEQIISILAIAGILLFGGIALGLVNRKRFSFAWLLTATGLVLLNDFFLTNGYGLIPNMIPGSSWNWQGKILALAATLAIASLPAFGWRRSGLTFKQAPGSLRRLHSRSRRLLLLLSCDRPALPQ